MERLHKIVKITEIKQHRKFRHECSHTKGYGDGSPRGYCRCMRQHHDKMHIDEPEGA